ncbi:MAG: winged helix-turn-helix transcriptional regulator [Cetobacterium sp.]|uniref:winged helix-turn-helix transcriptional regulator n=1 Tax=Cetobacterium sp. TaxID=2071632 RepID=UPI003F2A239F
METKKIDHCPVEVTALILGKKWIPTILFKLRDGEMRLGELQRVLGCSKKILIEQLNLLILHKIVENRKVYKENSVESYYYLTECGSELLPILVDMKAFGCKFEGNISRN